MTWTEIIGSMGFFCYFLYDINSVTWKNKFLQRFFLVGTLLVAFATGDAVVHGWKTIVNHPLQAVLFGAVALVLFCLLVYTLFFALPFEETYVEENHERKTYTEGMYALCRHPGVLWFALFYLALAGMIGTLRAAGDSCLLIFWNTVYICLQDRVIFPQTFSDYGKYRETTPFLFPDRESLGRCLRFFKGKGGRS